MKYAKQRDKNEGEVVEALEAVGASVSRIDGVGDFGVPDLLVGYLGATFLLEVKDAKGELRDTQLRWAKRWKGQRAVVVRNPEDALRALGLTIVQPGIWAVCRLTPPRNCDGRSDQCIGHHDLGTYPRSKRT